MIRVAKCQYVCHPVTFRTVAISDGYPTRIMMPLEACASTRTRGYHPAVDEAAALRQQQELVANLEGPLYNILLFLLRLSILFGIYYCYYIMPSSNDVPSIPTTKPRQHSKLRRQCRWTRGYGVELMGMETTGLNSATTTTTNSDGQTINMIDFSGVGSSTGTSATPTNDIFRRYSSFIIIKAVLMIITDRKIPLSLPSRIRRWNTANV
jgi:hypothetical protein